MDELERARRRRSRLQLIQAFNDFTDSLLPAEGVTDADHDVITDCMIKSLCHRIGDRDELLAWVEDIADIWFDVEVEE
jgi:hypothetical protein